MELYIAIGILGIISIIFFILFLIQKRKRKFFQNKFEELFYTSKQELLKYFSDLSERAEQDFQRTKTSYENRLSLLKIQLEEKQKAVNSNLELYKEGRLKEIDAQINLKKYQMERDLEDIQKIYEKKASEDIEKTFLRVDEAEKEYEAILQLLEDYRARREVINSQILREKELQEQADFYRVQLSDDDINDLHLIKEIESRFRNKEVIRKAAYETFVRRPAQEMVKRVVKDEKVSGIYCITYNKTGEIYIGRSVDIGNRWIEHLKSSFGLGSIASSSLHTKMARDGLWNFSFQILERVPKDKLSEREKYWIDMYGSQNLLNQRQGG